MRFAFRCALLLVYLCGCSFVQAQVGERAAVSENTVKAAFLYKFAGYVQWPDALTVAPGTPLSIGVIGASDFARELTTLTSGRTVADHPINVRQVTDDDTLDDLHILFIGEAERSRLKEVLAPARDRPILIVTESAGALAAGSIINFTVDRQRVRFDVALYAADQKQLRLNSRLLAVARRVYREPE